MDDEDETALARRWKSGVLLDFLFFLGKKEEEIRVGIYGFQRDKKG